MSQIYRKGNRWYYAFYEDGRKVKFSLGIQATAGNGRAINRKYAERLQVEIDYHRKSGTFDLEQWRSTRSAPALTLADFVEQFTRYLESQPDTYKATTRSHYRTSLQHLVNVFGNVPLTRITRQEVDQRFLPYLAQYRHNIRRTILIDCRAAFNRAVAWRYLGENPFAGINTKARKTVPVFYSEPELATMAAYFALPEIPDWQGDAVVLVLNTGLRRTELTTLTWANVLLEERRLVVRGAKHDKERVIPLNRTALEVLRRRPRPRGKKRVFWECNREGFGTAFKRMQQRTGLGGNIHQLRKTFASRCAINGMPLIKLKEILGHSDIQTVMIYATLAPDYMQDARDMPDISPGAP